MFSVKDEKWQGENTKVLTNKEEPIFVSAGFEKKMLFWGQLKKIFFPS